MYGSKKTKTIEQAGAALCQAQYKLELVKFWLGSGLGYNTKLNIVFFSAFTNKKTKKQAGAELCEAQYKLELVKFWFGSIATFKCLVQT